MERIVIMGKGGVGKSTVASNLSAVYALRGHKVLHVGCDPKHDSTSSLVDGRVLDTFMEKQLRRAGSREPWRSEDLVMKGRLGIDCVEAGGPDPGVGCAGRGITLMLEAFKQADLLAAGDYGLCMFDILGDVVCGGFAAPLRRGFGRKIVIVTSEELMALYAANNIAKAVRTYSANGPVLAGIVANLKARDPDRERVVSFAERLGTRVLSYLPRDPVVSKAEIEADSTAVEYDAEAPFSRQLRLLADELLAIRAEDCPPPTPIDDRDFFELYRSASRGGD